MPEEEKELISEFFDQLVLPKPVRILRGLIAACIWLLIFIHLLVLDILIPLGKLHPFIQNLVDYRLIVLIIIIAISWLMLGARLMMLFFGYIAFYPLLLVVWVIPKSMVKNWPTIFLLLPAVRGVFAHLKWSFMLFTIYLTSSILVIFTSNIFSIKVSMLLLFLYLLLHYFTRINNLYAPTTAFADLGQSIKKNWEASKKNKFYAAPVGIEEGTEEWDLAYNQYVMNIFMSSTVHGVMARKLKSLHDTRKFDLYFVSLFLYTFMLTIITFTLLYFGLSKIDINAFEPTVGFFEFLGYSFGTISHYQLSAISPLSGLAQIITYFEVFCSFIIIVLLVFVVFTSARERQRTDIGEVIQELELVSKHMENMLLENLNITLRNAEIKMLQANELLAKYFLRLKYDDETLRRIVSSSKEELIEEQQHSEEDL